MAVPTDEQLERAVEQYDRVQSFFARADSRASVILGLNLGMFSLLIVNAPPVDRWTPWHLTVMVPVALLGFSLFYVIKQAAPRLSGGSGSMIYFQAIAERTEAAFIKEFEERNTEAYYHDVLQQTHVNARIISDKFKDIRMSFQLLSVSVVFWLFALATFVVTNHSTDVFLKK